jgi:hypothetical protein
MSIDVLGWGLKVVPPVARWLVARLAAPRLSLSCEAREPWFQRTQVTVPGLDSLSALSRSFAYYYRVRVENLGGGQANACQLKLTRLWSTSEGRTWEPMREWQPVNLVWSGTGGVERAVYAADEAYADLGHVLSSYMQSNHSPDGRRVFNGSGGHAWLYLDVEPLFNSQFSVLGRGRYCFELRVMAPKARTFTTWIELNFPGEFAEIIDSAGRLLGGVTVASRESPPSEGEESHEG